MDDERAPSWKKLGLHSWEAVAVAYGKPQPCKPDLRAQKLEDAERRVFICEALGLDICNQRTITDALGNEIVLDDRVVAKLSAGNYRSRIPYIRWLPFGPANVVELWRARAISEATGAVELRDYYLVAVSDNQKFDGYVVMVGTDRIIFNVITFDASYADSKLRNGELLYKGYVDEARCSIGCCDRIIKNRREAGIQRDANRKLLEKLRKTRVLNGVLTRKIATLETRP